MIDNCVEGNLESGSCHFKRIPLMEFRFYMAPFARKKEASIRKDEVIRWVIDRGMSRKRGNKFRLLPFVGLLEFSVS
jgi:hypothetical protein